LRAPRLAACCPLLVISAMSQRAPLALGRTGLRTFAQDGVQARDVSADRPRPQWILQRLGRAAAAEAESLLVQRRNARANVRVTQVANFFSSHRCGPPPER